ncbi:MAG: hypothetical protein AB8C13_08440 [Phycisphaerales bacterium]
MKPKNPDTSHQAQAKSIHSARSMLVVLCALAGTAPITLAQNALGDGKGLQANPRQGSGGANYSRPSLEREVQFRNAIATGNAPGGLSFRGDLGYQAPGEFTGELGSDALFSFRRDSLYSGLAGMGIRGTDALQYQFSLTTGSQITRNLIGNLSVSRDGRFTSASQSGGFGDPGEPIATDPLESSIPGFGVSGTLRSTSSYSSTSGLLPEIVSVYERGIEREQFGVVATPLMGLVSTPMHSDTVRQSRTGAREPVRTSYEDTVESFIERAKRIRDESLRPQVRDPLGVDDPDDGSSQEKDPEVLRQETNQWIAERLGELQRQVLGLPSPAGVDEPIEVIEAADNPAVNNSPNGVRDDVDIRDPLDPRPDGEGIDGGAQQRGAPDVSFNRGEDLDARSLYTIDPDTLELIRGDGTKVTYLVDPNASTRDVYSEHMNAGEDLLKRGQYFDAEERFTSALSVRRGNVSAQLGRMHAQIGAGLVISASVNLQLLMSESLEMVSRQYSGDLLPSEERLRDLIFLLRERSGLEERVTFQPEEPARVRIACGLLISYLGYQLGDTQQMQDGFGVIRELGTESDLRLVRLLETVWGSVLADPPSPEPSPEPTLESSPETEPAP